MTPDDLLTIGDRVVAAAGPGEAVEAVLSWSRSTEVRVYEGDTEQFVAATNAGIGVRVVSDGRVGFAHAGSLDSAVVDEALSEARDNCRFATSDPFAGLAVPDGHPAPDLELVDERLASVSTADKIGLAADLERLVRAGDHRIVGLDGGADYADHHALGAVVSTEGLRVVAAETACTLSVYCLASDGDDTTVGFGMAIGRTPADLDVQTVASDAVVRAVRLLGAEPIPSRRLTVVFDPWVTAEFIGLVAEMFSGDAVVKGRSPFADRLDVEVAAPLVSLIDDPTDAAASGASPFDGEGLACRRNVLIDGGRVRGFLHDSRSGRAMGVTSTGSAVRGGYRSTPAAGPMAVKLAPGRGSQTQVIAGVDSGLFVQEVSGLHSGVNPVSGDFSVGIEGALIRGGELAEPVREVTIASTLQRMLADTVAVGADLTHLPFGASGVTLAIADVTVSGL